MLIFQALVNCLPSFQERHPKCIIYKISKVPQDLDADFLIRLKRQIKTHSRTIQASYTCSISQSARKWRGRYS